MTQKHHTHRFTRTEGAMTVLFCLIDDAYANLSPSGRRYVLMAAPLFELGLVATPGALRLAQTGAFDPAELLGRHVSGDWGDLDAFDRHEN